MELLRTLKDDSPRLAVDAFTDGLYHRLLRASPGGLTIKQDTLRKLIGAALDEFSVMDTLLSSPSAHGAVGLDGPGKVCPACSGGAEYMAQLAAKGEMPQSVAEAFERGAFEACHGACFDCCFGLPLLAGSGTATVHKPALQKFLIPDDVTKNFCSNPLASIQGDAPPTCADFGADNMLGRNWQRYSITGLGGAFCRHGLILCMTNLFTGEHTSHAARYAWYALLYARSLFTRVRCRRALGVRHPGAVHPAAGGGAAAVLVVRHQLPLQAARPRMGSGCWGRRLAAASPGGLGDAGDAVAAAAVAPQHAQRSMPGVEQCAHHARRWAGLW